MCFSVVTLLMTFLCYYLLHRAGKIARDAWKFLKYSYHSGAQNVSQEAWTPLLWQCTASQAQFLCRISKQLIFIPN